jgi:hypothetical protein
MGIMHGSLFLISDGNIHTKITARKQFLRERGKAAAMSGEKRGIPDKFFRKAFRNDIRGAWPEP